jgi:hypothetical protein
MSDSKTRGAGGDDRYFEEQIRKAADPDAELNSSLDFAGLVANMAELASLAPSWRDHVPHDAAAQFNANEAYQRQYGPHVDSCPLCQRLIETLTPRDDVLATVMESVEEVPLHEAIEELVRKLFGPGRYPSPVPAAAFAQRFGAPISTRTLQLLTSAEHSQNPLDQFGAAETYLRCYRPGLAYGLLARGLERCGLDHNIAVRIGNAPRFEGHGAEDLLELKQEQQTSAAADPIRAIEVSAQLGDHAAALRQIVKVIEIRGLKWRDGVSAASGSG